jgi:hypothetical protein
MLTQTMSALWLAAALTAPAGAQASPYREAKARRHFITLSFEKQYVQPFGFAKHPLGELLGQPVSEVHFENFQYRTEDGLTVVTVDEYGKRATALGATIYPFGSSVGATLAIRGSIETLPPIRVSFAGPTPLPGYVLINGRAMDLGVGVDMSDRAPGWGVGAHAFVLAGVGRADTELRDGRRYFVEGGGGVSSGPFGVDIAFKYSINRFTLPVVHSVHMIPISVRGTLTF